MEYRGSTFRLCIPIVATILALVAQLSAKQLEKMHLGDVGFREDARRVLLSRFRLRCGERFRYEYDFTDWKLAKSWLSPQAHRCSGF